MDFVKRSKEIFQLEINELAKTADKIGEEMNEAVELIYNCKGKLVIMGIGKTGIIGHKISSSLSSTGTQSIFVNAAEAMHGDLGMITKDDIVLLISNSGSSSEIINLIPPLKRLGCYLMAMTGNLQSPLAKGVSLVLNVGVEKEACPLGLAPTTSTTATLVMGDALMICLMERRNFKAENYALYHPGGALGRQLLSRVKDQMTTEVPKVYENTLFKDVIYEVSNKRLGMTMVYNAQEQVTGVITDGDIRRAIQRFDDIKQLKAVDFMTAGFKRIAKDHMLTEALQIMDKNNITNLAVTESDASDKVVGIISIHHIIDFQK
ncbi:KpsF/GutQ family sugar-phosphate isomerase [Paludibacter sp. 221]|uniref:KpsF/GutQ family sugar-phosphate isomerase n=1 Tax=Paludibacter sp. 221 TaxID=2302939 RepID=UPI0013D4F6F8|nr:KpsF/GutQ family sugar-phosphate isomerase [Paludibacter sp. 221]NDV46498.1 KpsF/GutQ family sugar-phosphate isomerase [Paludibacter sp. 221]